MNDHLKTYLRDHFAAAVGGVNLAERVESNNADTDFEEPLRRLRIDIERDCDTLSRVMVALDVERGKLKAAATWVGEKVARLKLNNRLVGYSPLSRVEELESLRGAVQMKRALWDTLSQIDLDGDVTIDFPAMCAFADEQTDLIDALHRRAVALAFDEPVPHADHHAAPSPA